MPERADLAWQAVSSRARLDLMRALMRTQQPMTARDLAAETGLGAPTIQTALGQLEAMGYVAASEPQGLRKGKQVTYEAAGDQFRDDFTELSKYLLG